VILLCVLWYLTYNHIQTEALANRVDRLGRPGEGRSCGLQPLATHQYGPTLGRVSWLPAKPKQQATNTAECDRGRLPADNDETIALYVFIFSHSPKGGAIVGFDCL
jgi:hypothetical protein